MDYSVFWDHWSNTNLYITGWVMNLKPCINLSQHTWTRSFIQSCNTKWQHQLHSNNNSGSCSCCVPFEFHNLLYCWSTVREAVSVENSKWSKWRINESYITSYSGSKYGPYIRDYTWVSGECLWFEWERCLWLCSCATAVVVSTLEGAPCVHCYVLILRVYYTYYSCVCNVIIIQ